MESALINKTIQEKQNKLIIKIIFTQIKYTSNFLRLSPKVYQFALMEIGETTD